MAGKFQFSSQPEIKYVAENSLRLHPVQKKLIEFTKPLHGGGMLSSADEMQLLQNLCRLIGARKVLDIGTFTGYSALSIALVLPPDGIVQACDISDEYPKLGLPFWKEAGVDEKIKLNIAPAVETLNRFIDQGETGTYDFAFLDADKENMDAYYELSLKLVRSGGIIALDNMLWSNKVIDPDVTDSSTVSLRALGKKIHADDRVNVSFLTVGDGTILAFKK